MHLRLAALGFGNVGRALAAMLASKAAELREQHDLTLSFTGAFTRQTGGWLSPQGISPGEMATHDWPKGHPPEGARPFKGDAFTFCAECPADVVVEITTLNPLTGQPALDHVRAALNAGRHVVTANKGPLAHACRELRALALGRGVELRFESTVMDGTPLFGMVEASLPATNILSIVGVLNSTSNFVLGRMAQGETVEAAVAAAVKLGIAEADPSYDLDGWDAAVKLTVLANVLMGANLKPQDVRREEVGAASMRMVHAVLPRGHVLKQLAGAERQGDSVTAWVRLVALPPSSLWARLTGMESGLRLSTDTLGELTLIQGEGGPGQTALGIMADLVNIARALEKKGGGVPRFP